MGKSSSPRDSTAIRRTMALLDIINNNLFKDTKLSSILIHTFIRLTGALLCWQNCLSRCGTVLVD